MYPGLATAAGVVGVVCVFVGECGSGGDGHGGLCFGEQGKRNEEGDEGS